MPRIERVQYDGDGTWLDVGFNDGTRVRFPVGLVYELARIVQMTTDEKTSAPWIEELGIVEQREEESEND